MTSFQNLMDEVVEVAYDTNLPCFAAGIYEAQIVKIGEPQAIEKKDKTTGYILPVFWKPLVEQVEGEPEKQNPKQKIWLDLTPEGRLDGSKGKNLGLGRLRKALNQNNPGWKITDLMGSIAKIQVKNFEYNDGTFGAEVVSVLNKE